MKTLNFLKSAIIIASTVFVLSSCRDKEEPKTDITVEDETALMQTTFADETNGKSGVTFVTAGAWTSTITEGTTKSTKAGTSSWVSITPDHGDVAGTYTIIISLDPNTTGKDRAATIAISCNSMDITITVTQKGEPANEDNDPEQTSGITYPQTGKYGLNILADDFLEAKKTEWGRFEYSVRAILPEGNSSLKLIIKPARQTYYLCLECRSEFNEEYNKCPKCGGTHISKIHPESLGWNQGSDFNWLITNVVSQFTWTYVDELVHKDGKVADASVIFGGDCIIEYYENDAKEPTRVKEIKVINSNPEETEEIIEPEETQEFTDQPLYILK